MRGLPQGDAAGGEDAGHVQDHAVFVSDSLSRACRQPQRASATNWYFSGSICCKPSAGVGCKLQFPGCWLVRRRVPAGLGRHLAGSGGRRLTGRGRGSLGQRTRLGRRCGVQMVEMSGLDAWICADDMSGLAAVEPEADGVVPGGLAILGLGEALGRRQAWDKKEGCDIHGFVTGARIAIMVTFPF